MAPHVLTKRRLHPILSGEKNSPDDASFDDAAASKLDGFTQRTSPNRMVGTKSQVDNGTINKSQATRIPLTHGNGAHSSSLLKLQADELLETLRHQYAKRAKSVENALLRLKTAIERIEDHEPILVRPVLDVLRKD